MATGLRQMQHRQLGQEVLCQAQLQQQAQWLDGHEIVELLDIEPGPRVGEALDFLLDQQIEGNITTRDEAVASVREKFGG